MRYYHNVPTGCAPKWEQISKATYNIMLDCYKTAEATPEQIAQRIKKECDPGDPIIYGPGDPKNAVTCEFYMSFEKGGECLIYAKCAGVQSLHRRTCSNFSRKLERQPGTVSRL